MGEAIAANLPATSGKSLEEWLATLDVEALEDAAAANEWLKAQGLGYFQARLVVQKWQGEPLYDDPDQIVADLFRGFGEQRRLYDQIIEQACARNEVVVNPCKGYMPLYSERNRISASIKPTRNGLYLGLIGDGFDVPTVPHEPSLGGSERMRVGYVATDIDGAMRAIDQSYHNETNGA